MDTHWTFKSIALTLIPLTLFCVKEKNRILKSNYKHMFNQKHSKKSKLLTTNSIMEQDLETAHALR